MEHPRLVSTLPESPATAEQAALAAQAWLARHQIALARTASWRKVGNEYFVVTADRSFHRAQVPTAACVLDQLVRGPTVGSALLDGVVAAFAVTPSQAAIDLQQFLLALVARGVAVASPSPPVPNLDAEPSASKAA